MKGAEDGKVRADRVAHAEAHLRKLLDTAYDAFVAIDSGGAIIEWNRQATEMFGWEREDVLGAPLADVLIPEQHREAHRTGLTRFLETGQERVMYQRLRLPALHRTGAIVQVELTISALELDEGYQFAAFLRDVGEDLAAERERLKREQLLEEAQRLAKLGSWEWDIATNTVTWSRQLYEMFGVEPGTPVTYESFLTLLDEPDARQIRSAVEEALRTGEAYELEHGVTRNGEHIRIAAQGEVVFSDDGEPIGLVGTAQDVTELREAERQRRELERERFKRSHVEALAEEARRSEARYRTLADSIPQHVWTTDAEGELLYMNSVAHEFYGVDVARLAAARGEGFVHPEDLQPNLDAWERALSEGTEYESRLRLRRHDGAYRWHLIRALPQRSEDGRITGWSGTSTDVHQQVEAEAARDRALAEVAAVAAELERSNRELDQFAYIASHDLRAPLRAVVNLADFIEEDFRDRVGDEGAEMLELMRSRARRMESLVEGILAYSRAGRMDVAVEPVDVGDLVRGLISDLEPHEGIVVVVDPDLPVVDAPRVPLEQVFQNLLSNAFKFVDPESGRVEISAVDRGDAWRFSVADNGRGIDPELHERVWEVFATLQPKDEIEGTGIGLAVVKKIVEAVGGRVDLESESGSGATFTFEWPRTQGR